MSINAGIGKVVMPSYSPVGLILRRSREFELVLTEVVDPF